MEYKNKEMNEEKTLAFEESESEETTMARTTTKEVGRLASFIPHYKKILYRMIFLNYLIGL